ncbi:MAG: hypothetical protein QW059_06105 [Nitrososphaerota archaeon]
MELDVKTALERFRMFIIYNTCLSLIPKGYLRDPTIFPERDPDKGEIYVEAASKIELAKIRDIRFVKVADILGVIYKSKTGNTNLKWRQIRGNIGRLTGVASPNSIVNLLEAKVITREYLEDYLKQKSEPPKTEAEGQETQDTTSTPQ